MLFVLFAIAQGLSSVSRQRDVGTHVALARQGSHPVMEHNTIREDRAQNGTEAAVIFASGTIGLEAQVAEGSDGEDEAGIEPQSATRYVGTDSEAPATPNGTAWPEASADPSVAQAVRDFEAAVAHLDHAVERAAEQEAALLEASVQKAQRAAAESAEAEAKSLLFKAASSPLIKEAEALVEQEVEEVEESSARAIEALPFALGPHLPIVVVLGISVAILVIAWSWQGHTKKAEAPRKSRSTYTPSTLVLPIRVPGARVVCDEDVLTDSQDERVIRTGTCGVVRENCDSDLLIDFDGEMLSRWVIAVEAAKLRAATPTDILNPVRPRGLG